MCVWVLEDSLEGETFIFEPPLFPPPLHSGNWTLLRARWRRRAGRGSCFSALSESVPLGFVFLLPIWKY